MHMLLIALSLIACDEPKPEKKASTITGRDAKELAKLLKQKREEPAVTSGVFPAAGQDAVERVIYREDLYATPKLPNKGVDILAQLGIHVINEMPEMANITDDDIRAAADLSYNRLGIADESLRGWTLSVRPSDQLNATSFNDKQKLIIVEMQPPMLPFVGPHELTHALAGNVTKDERLPGIMNEFIATAAEVHQPPGAELNPFTYEILNRPILGTAKNVDGEADRIHAAGAPLDGMRYELLRAAGKKIGDEAYRKLATEIYTLAAKKSGPVTLDELQPLFAEAGIGDCVLFTHTDEPGVYVDLAIATDHSPVVLTKYVDGMGQETKLEAPFSLTWKKNGETVN